MLAGMLTLAFVVLQLDLVSSYARMRPGIIYYSHSNCVQAIRHFDIRLIALAIGFGVTGVSLFLYCHYGQMTTDSYERFADRLFEIQWIHLPNDLQQYFILMNIYASDHVDYHGFGIFKVNLNTFAEVMKWSNFKSKE